MNFVVKINMLWFISFFLFKTAFSEELSYENSQKLQACVSLIDIAVKNNLVQIEKQEGIYIDTEDFYGVFQEEIALNCLEKISEQESERILGEETNFEDLVWLVQLESGHARLLFEERQQSFQTFDEDIYTSSRLRVTRNSIAIRTGILLAIAVLVVVIIFVFAAK